MTVEAISDLSQAAGPSNDASSRIPVQTDIDMEIASAIKAAQTDEGGAASHECPGSRDVIPDIKKFRFR